MITDRHDAVLPRSLRHIGLLLAPRLPLPLPPLRA